MGGYGGRYGVEQRRGHDGEAAAVVVGGDTDPPYERPAHRLGGAEPGPGRGDADQYWFGRQDPPGGVDAYLFDVLTGWAAQQPDELAGQVPLAHPDPGGDGWDP